ncbi:MAG TPA: hypothetical protein DEG42_02455 [Acholeplasmataceae bacterium]|nr:hypothetical protein [Acholeplasmataceae bacterium]
MKKTLFKKVVYAVLTMSLAILASTQTTFAAFEDGVQAKYGTDFASFDEEKAAAAEFNVELAGESFILLKNEGNTLPFATTEKYVSLFGTRSDNIILGGSGSGGGSAIGSATIKSSLEAVGFRVNPALVSIYSATTATVELPLTALAAASSSYAMFDDAALVVISRTGSEFNDAALYAAVGHTNLLDHYYSLDDNEKALVDFVGSTFDKVVVIINSAHPLEMGWLEDHADVDSILWVGHPGTTGMTALGQVLKGLVNPSGKTSDVYPAKFAMDPTWANFKGNIQSQLVLGEGADANKLYTYYEAEGSANNVLAPLNNGTDGIASNDWAYYSYSRVTDSSGGTVTVDGPSKGSRYYATLDYEEGIYMGYRWYETADAEGFFDTDTHGLTVAQRIANTPIKHAGDLYYNRLDGVIYPFGYGLSYTTFDVEIASAKHDGMNFVSGGTLNTAYGQEITLNVSVKNTGTIAGKKVVQVYYSAPYFFGEIEKSSVTLVEFAKSDLLKPGQTQIIPITFKIQNMASFDYNDANLSGHAGYELDPGIYQIGVYDSASDVLDSINAQVLGAVVNYDIDAETGNAITVKFTGDGVWDGTRSDLDYYDSRRTELVSETPMTYLTRADFQGTLPQAPVASDLRFTDDAIQILTSQIFYTAFNDLPTDPWYKTAADATTWDQADDVTARVDGKTLIQLYEMSGVDYDDPKWDVFLNQLTFEELKTLISRGQYGTLALDSIGKPASSDQDGPAQIKGGTFWVSEVNIASTWNTELAYKQGLFVGNESLYAGTHGWYGPGLNTHRNPAAGRNFEYYSQDGLHSGKIGAAVIKGATDKGVTVYMKHLFLNDQETSRYTVTTFVTEQAMREIYIKPFELAIKEGKATASMSGFNKVGLLSTTSNYNLYEGLLREEFGFQYASVTDYYGWGYTAGSTGDMSSRLNIIPLGTWTASFGRNIEGTWDAVNNNVVVTFTEDITNGTKWVKDDATGTTTSTINATNPISINKINSRDFADYATTGVLVDYATSTENGPSAAYKDATTMKDGSVLYAKDETLVSYTQWSAVRTTAKSLLFAHANSNTMKNNIVTTGLVGLELAGAQGVSIPSGGFDVAIPSLPGAVYTLPLDQVLPVGLTLTSAGRITGTTYQAGTFTVKVTATMYGYITATVQHTISISATFAVTGLDAIRFNEQFSGSVASPSWYLGMTSGSGSQAAIISSMNYSLISGQLPVGLTLNSDGTISGVPTVAGTYQAIVQTDITRTRLSNQALTFFTFSTPITIVVPSLNEADYSDVSFNGNFENGLVQVFSVKNGNTASPVAAPYRPGYVFTGWYTDALTTTLVDFSTALTADTVVYAGWVALDADEVALDAALLEIDALIAALDLQIAALDTQLAALGTQTGENADDIVSIEALIVAVNAAIDSSNAAIAASNGDLDDLAVVVSSLSSALTALETALESADGLIADDLETLELALANLNALLAAQDDRLDLIDEALVAPETGCGSAILGQNSMFILFTVIAFLSIGFIMIQKRKNHQI